jgi:hypothetical protein
MTSQRAFVAALASHKRTGCAVASGGQAYPDPVAVFRSGARRRWPCSHRGIFDNLPHLAEAFWQRQSEELEDSRTSRIFRRNLATATATVCVTLRRAQEGRGKGLKIQGLENTRLIHPRILKHAHVLPRQETSSHSGRINARSKNRRPPTTLTLLSVGS